jgi:hypothetical protein
MLIFSCQAIQIYLEGWSIVWLSEDRAWRTCHVDSGPLRNNDEAFCLSIMIRWMGLSTTRYITMNSRRKRDKSVVLGSVRGIVPGIPGHPDPSCIIHELSIYCWSSSEHSLRDQIFNVQTFNRRLIETPLTILTTTGVCSDQSVTTITTTGWHSTRATVCLDLMPITTS